MPIMDLSRHEIPKDFDASWTMGDGREIQVHIDRAYIGMGLESGITRYRLTLEIDPVTEIKFTTVEPAPEAADVKREDR